MTTSATSLPGFLNDHRVLPWSFTYSSHGLADLIVRDVSRDEEEDKRVEEWVVRRSRGGMHGAAVAMDGVVRRWPGVGAASNKGPPSCNSSTTGPSTPAAAA